MSHSPAAFDTLRRQLGLSLAETATVLGVPIRHVRYWTGTKGKAVPDIRVAKLLALKKRMEDIVALRLEVALGHNVEEVKLHRHLSTAELDKYEITKGIPVGAYAMITAWTMEALEANDIQSGVRWQGAPS